MYKSGYNLDAKLFIKEFWVCSEVSFISSSYFSIIFDDAIIILPISSIFAFEAIILLEVYLRVNSS